MTLRESIGEELIKEFREKFPQEIEISDRPGSFVILRSDREQRELEQFILQTVIPRVREDMIKDFYQECYCSGGHGWLDRVENKMEQLKSKNKEEDKKE